MEQQSQISIFMPLKYIDIDILYGRDDYTKYYWFWLKKILFNVDSKTEGKIKY